MNNEKVLIIIGDAAEALDTLYPLYRVQEDNFAAVVAAPEVKVYPLVMHEIPPGWTITRESPSYHLASTIAFRDVNPEEYAGMFITGGRAPEYLRYDQDLMRITRYFFEKGKPVACVCHGIEIIAAADVIRGKRVATVAKCRYDAEQSGATYVDDGCVRDGNLVTGRTWKDNALYMPEFMRMLSDGKKVGSRGLGAKPVDATKLNIGALLLSTRGRAGEPAIRLQIGNYGMQQLPVDQALAAIRKIGYDGAELCCMPDWPSDPGKLDSAARRRIRECGLPIPSLIESFNLMAADTVRAGFPARIEAAAMLAHDLAPKSPPLLQTVLGGKQGGFEKDRDVMADRLAEWARVAQKSGIVLAVKAHALQACDTPAKLLWLLDKVNSPALTGIYDYGHFQGAGLSIEETMDALLPRSAFITVKDFKLVNGQPAFLLPGDGSIDYTRYFTKVKQMKWRGWVLVEVTRQLQTQPGYDGVEAAKHSYANLALVLSRLGLR